MTFYSTVKSTVWEHWETLNDPELSPTPFTSVSRMGQSSRSPRGPRGCVRAPVNSKLPFLMKECTIYRMTSWHCRSKRRGLNIHLSKCHWAHFLLKLSNQAYIVQLWYGCVFWMWSHHIPGSSPCGWISRESSTFRMKSTIRTAPGTRQAHTVSSCCYRWCWQLRQRLRRNGGCMCFLRPTTGDPWRTINALKLSILEMVTLTR